MLISALIVVLLAYFVAGNFYLHAFPEKLFVLVFSISTIYYGVLGPWYWSEFKNSTFLGIDWSGQFPTAIFSFVLVYLIVVGTISIVGARSERDCFLEGESDVGKLMPRINLLLWLGFFSCAYVYIVGGALAESEMLVTSDPFLNIFFQFADLSIGTLLFLGVSKGFDKKWIALASVFVAYAVISGFRSKLALLLGPLLLYLFFLPRKNQLLMRGGMFIFGLIIVMLFSVMTIVRVKFSGFDMDALAGADMDEYLYGLFAETNLIFGLSSALATFGEKIPFAGLTPFTEVITQFVPRFVDPDKDLYLHLKQAAWWLANSQEAQDSGTAMPFYGEYYAAFGWLGVVLFVILYAAIVIYLIRFIRRYALTKNQYLMGAALIAVFFGYYYFSRGSVAQIFKGMLFACGPYFYLTYIHSKSESSSNQLQAKRAQIGRHRLSKLRDRSHAFTKRS